jgi:hypothetical protein
LQGGLLKILPCHISLRSSPCTERAITIEAIMQRMLCFIVKVEKWLGMKKKTTKKHLLNIYLFN